MLIKCLTSLKDQHKEWRGVRVYGQELNALTAAIARMNLFLHGVEEFTIANADTLEKPAFIKNGRLQQFDIVLANPPYSIKQWNREAFASDLYGRNMWGTPPQGRADYAFLQHIVKSLDPQTGRCAVLFPHGVLFRKEEREMREQMIKSDMVDCVIGLGPNLFYNSPMEACIIICRTRKDTARKKSILFINAIKEVTRKNAESYLEDEHIRRVAQAYLEGKQEDDFCRLVQMDEIVNNNYDLSIQKYIFINATNETGTLNLKNSLSDWEQNHNKGMVYYENLIKML